MLVTLKVHTVRIRVIVAAIGVGVVVGVAVAGRRAVVAAAVVVALLDHVISRCTVDYDLVFATGETNLGVGTAAVDGVAAGRAGTGAGTGAGGGGDFG